MKEEKVIRVHAFFSGLVQGVNFRYYTAIKARELGVRGWVKNLSDGRVEAVFEGPEESVKQVLEYCRRGHPIARVESVELKEETPLGEEDFRIVYH